ncbi:hypothetical protein ACOSP7_016222 [Xanthoceras sorbifolium]
MASLGGYFTETASGNLNPHLVTVPIGEDLAGKILSFSRNSSKALCVLSATGTVSSVVLCQSGCVANGLKFVLVVATFEQNDKENERSSLASDQKTSPDISGSSKYP